MPAERFRYSRVAHLEAGRKLVEEDSETLTNLILRNVHVVPEKEPFNLLLRNVAVFVAFAIIYILICNINLEIRWKKLIAASASVRRTTFHLSANNMLHAETFS